MFPGKNGAFALAVIATVFVSACSSRTSSFEGATEAARAAPATAYNAGSGDLPVVVVSARRDAGRKAPAEG